MYDRTDEPGDHHKELYIRGQRLPQPLRGFAMTSLKDGPSPCQGKGPILFVSVPLNQGLHDLCGVLHEFGADFLRDALLHGIAEHGSIADVEAQQIAADDLAVARFELLYEVLHRAERFFMRLGAVGYGQAVFQPDDHESTRYRTASFAHVPHAAAEGRRYFVCHYGIQAELLPEGG